MLFSFCISFKIPISTLLLIITLFLYFLHIKYLSLNHILPTNGLYISTVSNELHKALINNNSLLDNKDLILIINVPCLFNLLFIKSHKAL